ncbi:hypothetical protein LTR78_009624 [Recurvomyces mirabilis]|uniref:Amino acid transporter n=2 Tax=Recurvomyces mirabilis TaxID=574656 RepID=A0AAE0TP62_9PEZI|nr:hypothetical protein LTR78_009624 [Recurvomyces mirabilis]
MDEAKHTDGLTSSAIDHGTIDQSDLELEEKRGNDFDQRGMIRMGKRQELRREFHFFSIWGFAVILGCSWEYVLVNGVLSLPNGGTAGSVWMFLIACIGMFLVVLSMAEMASIAPTAGGQYHWCSEFAPPQHQKFLSYTVGYLCVLGWHASLAGTCYAAGQQVEAIIVLANPNYTIQTWQTALLALAIVLVAIMFNTVLYRKLPLVEGIVMIVHVFGFFAIIVVLWVMAPRSDASVLTTFSSNGWSSAGVACLVGISAPIGDLIGADSSVHLSEELKNAAWILPRSMIATALANYVLGFVTIITLVFCLGDLDTATTSSIGQPYVEVILNATGSTAATITLTIVMFILLVSCAVNTVTTSSRQLWSFARDGGPPFSNWLSKVRPGWDVPMNAMTVSFGFTAILACIVIGSATAYGVFVTLVNSGLLSSYAICIGCILQKRLRGETFPPSRFSLGQAGNVINIAALCFLVVAWVFQFFPSAPDPTATSMNWSVMIFGAVIVFFTIYYITNARHRYTGPVVHVRKDL